MIEKDEIEQKAEEFGIHAANVERDYVFGWLLAGIFGVSPLKDTLILKGGNCFRKAYFPLTRFSPDLDFSTQSGVRPDLLIEELNRTCDFVQAQAGIVFDKNRNKVEQKNQADRDRTVYQARLYSRDFYGNPDTITISVRLDVAEFDRIYLPVQSRFLVHPYSDARECRVEIKCHKLEELLATKLKCLLQRRHSSDLYDYVYAIFVNRDIDVQRGEIVTTFLKKTIFERSPGVVRGLLLDLPFEVFRGLWTKYLVCPRQSIIDFDVAIENFRRSIGELFGEFRVDYGGQLAFYPARFRNPIMEAGSSQTLLEVVYDGQKRLVEPYSLVYKRRKDGVGNEYFYVYDRTGGRSGPGIKAFLHGKIMEIKNTAEKYEPRFPIELTKAGEYGRKTYFGLSFGGASSPRRPRRARSVSTSGPTYVVECTCCDKRFRRKKSGTRLNKHKDRYGNQCYGRTGYVVDTIYAY